MTTTTANLAALASDALGIDIGVTDTHRAYHYADETGRAFWLTRNDLRYAIECAANPDTRRDAYSHWCAGTGREMSDRSMRALGLGG